MTGVEDREGPSTAGGGPGAGGAGDGTGTGPSTPIDGTGPSGAGGGTDPSGAGDATGPSGAGDATGPSGSGGGGDAGRAGDGGGAKAGRLERWYGAGPLHVAAIAVNVVISGYAITRILAAAGRTEIGIWFGAAILANDFVIVPALAAGDWALRRLAARRPGRVPWLNYVRIPLLLSGLTLLFAWPLAAGVRGHSYQAKTGLPVDVYGPRVLAVVAAVWIAALLAYAATSLQHRRAAA